MDADFDCAGINGVRFATFGGFGGRGRGWGGFRGGDFGAGFFWWGGGWGGEGFSSSLSGRGSCVSGLSFPFRRSGFGYRRGESVVGFRWCFGEFDCWGWRI